MSNWFDRVRIIIERVSSRQMLIAKQEDVEPTVLVKKPNPRNEQNAAKLEELEQEVKR